MLGALLTILAPLLSFAMGSAFPNPQFTSTIATQKYFTGRCFQVEPNEKLVIEREDLDRVHDQYPTQEFCYDGAHRDESPNGLIDSYTRIRRGVRIIPFKISEGDPVIGGCTIKSAIRWVGQQGDKQIYWEDNNYQFQDLRNFVEVLVGRGDKSNVTFLSQNDEQEDYVFDIYAKDSILNSLPDYVVNCQESGGLVPVVEGASGIRPPQVVPIKDIDSSLFKKNFEKAVLKQNTSFPPYKNYLIKIDKQDLPPNALPDGQIGIYTTPLVKNEKFAYDVIYHVGAFYLRDQKDQASYVYGTAVDVPPQTIQQNPSLQLGRLWFRVVDSWTVFTPQCKPAIYLYPEKQTDVNVKVNLLGKLTKTDPQYDFVNGWNVKAFPDGTIQQFNNLTIEQSKTYPYLFYEALLDNGYKPQTGWVIARQNIDKELNVILTTLGLNEKEKNDFLSYWVARLTSKPYYFAGLVPIEEINNQEELSINPSPSNVIRVRLMFEGLDYPISVGAPNLSSVNRNGFTVVDWGGSVIGESCEGKRIQ